MINVEMARDYATRARRFLKEAEMALAEGDSATSVRRSQEALEMVVKALLRALGIEYPRSHDVSDALIDHKDALPEGLRGEADDLARLVSQLASVRGPALYGYEREGVPASKAFSRDYAEGVLSAVRRYVSLVEGALREARIID